MALKITTQIGTDKGITSEAYIRISEYQISKHGSASFKIEIFQSESDKTLMGAVTSVGGVTSRNQQIGDFLNLALTKEVDATRIIKKSVEIVTPETTDSDGNIVPESRTWELQDIEEDYKRIVPDLSGLEQSTIFQFAYAKLKDKLADIFGAENIIDC
jgi:hypothetical protein